MGAGFLHHQHIASQRFPSCATPPRVHSALDPMVTSCKVCQAGLPSPPLSLMPDYIHRTEFIQQHSRQCEISRKQTHKKQTMALFDISNKSSKRTHIFHLMHLERSVEHEPTVEWGQKDLTLYESCHSYEPPKWLSYTIDGRNLAAPGNVKKNNRGNGIN